jgi:hypothetical protein
MQPIAISEGGPENKTVGMSVYPHGPALATGARSDPLRGGSDARTNRATQSQDIIARQFENAVDLGDFAIPGNSRAA